MNEILTLALATVALLLHGCFSFNIDTKNCSRTWMSNVNLGEHQNLSTDLKDLGFDVNSASRLMSYTLFDEDNIARIYTDNMTQYVLVYADSNEKADYICAENITEVDFRDYYVRCKLSFVLSVNINDCRVVNSTTTTLKELRDQKVLKAFKRQKLDDSKPVTITYITSSTIDCNLYLIDAESASPMFFALQSGMNIPRSISEKEYNAYIHWCNSLQQE